MYKHSLLEAVASEMSDFIGRRGVEIEKPRMANYVILLVFLSYIFKSFFESLKH